MKGDRQMIAMLNGHLTNELTAINQYFLHSRIFRHWGLDRLGKKEYDESIGEMKRADRLIERILMLDGLPNLQNLHKVAVGETAPEILQCDLALEQASQGHLREAIAHAESVRDYVSRELLEDILEDTEAHIDWLETQLELIGRIGLENYQQSMMGDGAS